MEDKIRTDDEYKKTYLEILSEIKNNENDFEYEKSERRKAVADKLANSYTDGITKSEWIKVAEIERYLNKVI